VLLWGGPGGWEGARPETPLPTTTVSRSRWVWLKTWDSRAATEGPPPWRVTKPVTSSKSEEQYVEDLVQSPSIQEQSEHIEQLERYNRRVMSRSPC